MTDTTQMIAGPDCPVCGAANGAAALWCADCGFRLDSVPGETAAPAGGYRLLGAGDQLPLKAGDNVVGRIQADVFLSDPSISRRHAVIRVGDEGVTVRDEGSSNGSRVAGVVLVAGEDTPVQPGQAIQFGTVTMRLSGPDGSEAEPPETEVAVVAPGTVAHLKGGAGAFPLKDGANSIGRRPGNDIVIPDPYVSGQHAVITMEDGRATLVDSGSSNGTFLGERRVEPGAEEELRPGQEIRFGRATVTFVPAESADEGTEPDAAA